MSEVAIFFATAIVSLAVGYIGGFASAVFSVWSEVITGKVEE